MLVLLWQAMLLHAVRLSQVDLLQIILIAKPLGGDRPIGIFFPAIRVLNRWLRATVGEKWRLRCERAFFYGSKGKASTACAWRTAMLQEHALRAGKPFTAYLLDIVNLRLGSVRDKAMLFYKAGAE